MKKVAKNPNVSVEAGVFKLDRVSALQIAQQFGTPSYIFLENKIRANCRNLKKELQSLLPAVRLFYSVKSNFLPSVCKTVHEEGYGVEVVSQLEYHHVKRLGFLPREIIAGGPYLPGEFLDELLSDNVREIVLYNRNTLKNLIDLGRNRSSRQPIAVFFIPERHGRRLGFSLIPEEIKDLSQIIQNLPNFTLQTISCHFGTQILNCQTFIQMASNLIGAITQFEQYGLKISNLNLGGGFPEANSLNREKIRQLGLSLKEILNERGFNDLGVVFEPGRYIVGDAGVILSSVYLWDETERWAYIDAGNHICPKFSKSSLRFYNVSRPLDSNEFKTNIGGIIPSDQDVLAKNYFLTEKVGIGDIVAILNAGAYTITFSNRFPFPFPPIIWIKDEQIVELTKRGQVPDIG